MKDQNPINILIIEDNMGDYLLIKDYLEEQLEIPNIVHSKKYSEAMEVLNANANSFDVVLLDLTLPDKTGESLIKEVVAKCPDAPVIVLTGFADLEFSIKSLYLKVSDYLLKNDITATSLYKSIKYNIERKKTNLLLEESEKRYSNLFQLSPQPMWIFDLNNFSFLQVNKAAIDLYDYTEEEFQQMSLFDIVVDELNYEEKKAMAQTISKVSNVYKGRFKHMKKSKEIIDVDIYSNLITINDTKYESVIAIDVTEKTRLELKITKAIIKTQEDERYEIGTELHDNVCQILASSQLSLEMLKDNIPPESEQWFNKSKQFINLALDEIRNISHRLAPSFFDYSTIEDTFQELIDNFNVEKKHEVSMHFELVGFDEKLNSEIQLNLYRILQEQLRNIIKYAKATKIKVALKTEEDILKFIISDNGIGFNYEITKKGIGLANIRRRAELFSGSMQIETSPGNGCTLIVRIPFRPQ